MENAPNAIKWNETDYCTLKWQTAVKNRMGTYYWRPRYMTRSQIEVLGLGWETTVPAAEQGVNETVV